MLDVALAVAGGAPILPGGRAALTVAFDVHLKNDCVMDETVNRGEGHGGGIREHGRAFAEGSIRCDQQALALVSGSDQLKQRAGFSLIAVNVAQVIENNQVVLVELVDGVFQ